MTWPAWFKPSWVARVEIADPPEGLEAPCWLWKGATTPAGYPRANIANGSRGGEQVYLHRYAWEQHHMEKLGEDDGGHLCGRPPCFQPEHIEKQSRAFNRGTSTAPRYGTASFLPLDDLAALACGWWLKRGCK